MSPFITIKWHGVSSVFTSLQKTHAVHKSNASVVLQRLQKETSMLLHPPVLAYKGSTRKLEMSQSSFDFVQDMTYNASRVPRVVGMHTIHPFLRSGH